MDFINRTIFIKSLACGQYLRADTPSFGGPIFDTLCTHIGSKIFGYNQYVNLSLNRGEWEEFKMLHIGDDRFIFKCYNGKYVRVEDKGGIVLNNNIDDDFDNDKIFEVTERENGYYTIKSVKYDRYFTAYGEDQGIRISDTNKNINNSNLFIFENKLLSL